MTSFLLLGWTCGSSILALALFPGTLELVLLSVAALFRPRSFLQPSCADAYKLTVVIPAHNEELLIQNSVASVFAADQTGIDLRVVVIADNCTDRTAAQARAAQAEVLERTNHEQRGKGPALHFAFETLLTGDSAAYAVVDADTQVDANFLTETVSALRSGAAATQSRYLVGSSSHSTRQSSTRQSSTRQSSTRQSSTRQNLVRLVSGAYNILRARGRAALGFSAGIYGNGFALTAATLQAVPYTACSIVEDIEYHLALIGANRSVSFLDSTAVHAPLPASNAGAESQRARWDGGRLRVARINLPKIALQLLTGKFRFFEAFLDLTLLPLVFHALLLVAVSFSPLLTIRDFGLAGLAIMVLHLSAAAFIAGRGWRDLGALTAVPLFVAWKILLIPSLLKTSRKGAEWVRTERVPDALKPEGMKP